MSAVYFLFLLVIEILGPIALLIGLVWGVLVLRRGYREGRSFSASKGNTAEMCMQWDRLKARLLSILGFLLWPVAFVAALYYGAGFQMAVTIASVCAGVCWLWAAHVKARYNASFKENIVNAELSKVFGSLRYEPRGQFEKGSISGLVFFKHADSVGGSDLITADYKGKRFAQCDIKVQQGYTVTATDNDGGTREETRWEDVFKGRAMRFDFADKFRGKVQVIKKNFEGARVSSSRGNWQPVETELAEFNDHFEVFALDPMDAMAVLTPQMIEGISYLNRALDVPMAFYFTDNAMFAFLSLSRDAFDVSGKKTLLEEKELLQKDMQLITGFLDTMYFKRQETEESPAEAQAENRVLQESAADTRLSVPVGSPSRGFSVLPHSMGYRAGKILRMLKKNPLLTAYFVSAVVTLVKYPYTILITMSAYGGLPKRVQDVPTLAYLAVTSLFICVPLLAKGGGFQAKLAAFAAFLGHLSFII
ncbi:MAG: DUF3137 domain-containing protein [Synergistaceae bacterium]|jgi:hypothetical protein|nr:DUF3137 domain-containing protein [Synergistaceae bacterium]